MIGTEDGLEAYMWSMRDEAQYDFIARKYSDRKKLAQEADAARKGAEQMETVNGKPNPHYPRLRLEADMAQLRLEMAYMVEKNEQLVARIEILADLSQRVSILEGAYGHISTTCKEVSRWVLDLMRKDKPQTPATKEHRNEKV